MTKSRVWVPVVISLLAIAMPLATAFAAPRIFDGFESRPVGAPPVSPLISVVENKGDSIAVTEETAASGKHSLKVVDAPGLSASYNPQLYCGLGYRDGFARCEFDIRVENGAKINYEWRDWSKSPYKVGPSFVIQQGKLYVGNQELLEVPIGQWVHFKVVAGLGNQATGTWDLIVTLPGREPLRFTGLRFGHWDMKVLTWLGFLSLATDSVVFYLDNIEIANDQDGNSPLVLYMAL